MLGLVLLALAALPPSPDGSGALQQAKLTSPEPDATQFADRLALHGDWLVVRQFPASSSNQVLVFRRHEGAWQFFQSLDPTYTYGELSLDVDAQRIAVGGRSYSAGIASTYTFDGSAWVYEAHMDSSVYGQWFGSYFGSDVAIDGDRLAVGADEDLSNGYAGFVTVFERTSSGWVVDEILDAPPAAGCGFGSGVDLSGDWLLARRFKWFFCAPGVAFLFERTSGGWVHRETWANGSNAISIDGDLLAVGRDLKRLVGGQWLHEATLVPGAGFSSSFALNDVDIDGERIAVGDPGADGGLGAVYVYEHAAGSWTLSAKLTADVPTTRDVFGESVELSHGRTATGATTYAAGGVGAAFVHVLSTQPSVHCSAKTNSQGCQAAMSFTGSSSLSSAVPFELAAGQVLNAVNGILFYGYGPADTPFQGGSLCAVAPVRRTALQNSGGTAPPAVDCSGTFSFDMNAHAQSGLDLALVVGVEVSAQYWYRDPADPAGFGSGLSDALAFVICP